MRGSANAAGASALTLDTPYESSNRPPCQILNRERVKHATATSHFGAIIIVLLSGCTSSQDYNVKLSSYYDVLSKSVTPRQRKHILSVLESESHRDEAIRGLIKNWGTRSSEYDLAVLDFLRLYKEEAAITECAIDRLREDPSLIRQVFWNYRWESEKLRRSVLPNADMDNDSTRFASRVYRDLFTHYRNDSQNRLYIILFVASMLDCFPLVENLSQDNLQTTMNDVGRRLQADAPYLYFDAERGIYVVDAIAKKNRVPVKSSRQEWTAPATPLPSK